MQRVKKLLTSSDPLKWLFLGDSLTEGSRHTWGYRDYTELFRERVSHELDRRRDVIINTAISGHNSSDLLADFNWRVRQFAPHLVFIMVGANDASPERPIAPKEFRANYLKLLQLIREIPGAIPVLQTSALFQPNDVYAPRLPNLLALMDIVRDIAAAEKLPLIDHTRHWQDAFAQNTGRGYFWMNNICHPNQFGHRVIANLIFKELGIFDENAFTCRLFVP